MSTKSNLSTTGRRADEDTTLVDASRAEHRVRVFVVVVVVLAVAFCLLLLLLESIGSDDGIGQQ
jgi:hypothetical protein